MLKSILDSFHPFIFGEKMKILRCIALPVVRLTMTVVTTEIMGKDSNVSDEDGFHVYLPSRIVRLVEVGDVLHVLCVPNADLSATRQTLVVSIQNGGKGVIRPLWSHGDFWAELYNGIIP